MSLLDVDGQDTLDAVAEAATLAGVREPFEDLEQPALSVQRKTVEVHDHETLLVGAHAWHPAKLSLEVARQRVQPDGLLEDSRLCRGPGIRIEIP